MNLNELGWNKDLAAEFALISRKDHVPGRVVAEHKNIYIVISEESEFKAELSGRYWYDLQQACAQKGDLPAVGDWVEISHQDQADRAMIHNTLSRKSKFSRKMKVTGGKKFETFENETFMGGGRTEEQIVAANVDLVVLVLSSDSKVNSGLVERFLTSVWESGSEPLIVLNKIDIDIEWPEKVSIIDSYAMGTPVLAVSAETGNGVEELESYLASGKTVAFIGKSGVGKSTLINRVLGYDRQTTGEVRVVDSKGKHTTTYRELIPIPGKGVLLDTPGMRELKLWATEDTVNKTFEDIEVLMTQCRFRNCSHNGEPGCAVSQAIEEGSLSPEHYQRYLKQKRELRFLQRKIEQRERKISRSRKGRSGIIKTDKVYKVKK